MNAHTPTAATGSPTPASAGAAEAPLEMAKVQKAFGDGFRLVGDRMVGVVLRREKTYECTGDGLKQALRRLNRQDVAKHRAGHVAITLDKPRYGKVRGKGRWTRDEHAAFCRSCNKTGVKQYCRGASALWASVAADIGTRSADQVERRAKTYFNASGSVTTPQHFYEDVGDGGDLYEAIVVAVQHSGDETATQICFPPAPRIQSGAETSVGVKQAARLLRTAVGDRMDPGLNPGTWWHHTPTVPPWTTSQQRRITNAKKKVASMEKLVASPAASVSGDAPDQLAAAKAQVVQECQRALDNLAKTKVPAFLIWRRDVGRLRTFLAGDEEDRDYARAAGLITTMCPSLFISCYDGITVREAAVSGASTLGTWICPTGHSRCPDGRCHLRVHCGNGFKFTPICLRDSVVDQAEDETVELNHENRRYSNVQGKKALEQPLLRRWYHRVKDRRMYVASACENANRDLVEQVPSMAYPYLAVGVYASGSITTKVGQSPDSAFGEGWRVVGFEDRNGNRVPICNKEELETVLEYVHPSEVRDGGSGGVGDGGSAASGNETQDVHQPGKFYHEAQTQLLCGMHALNNIVQGPHVTRAMMDSAAVRLNSVVSAVNYDGGASLPHHSPEKGSYELAVLNDVLVRLGFLDVLGGDGSEALNVATLWRNYRTLHGVDGAPNPNDPTVYMAAARCFVNTVHANMVADSSIVALLLRPCRSEHYYVVLRDHSSGRLVYLNSTQHPTDADVGIDAVKLQRLMLVKNGSVLEWAHARFVAMPPGTTWSDAARIRAVGNLRSSYGSLGAAATGAHAPMVNVGAQFYSLAGTGVAPTGPVSPPRAATTPPRLQRPDPFKITLFMRRCSQRVVTTCSDPLGREAVRRRKTRARVAKMRENNDHQPESTSYTDPKPSAHPDVMALLENYYGEGGLTLSEPREDYLREVSAKEKAALLMDWGDQYNNRDRISVCACCGGRDIDARPVKEVFVPLTELRDMFELNKAEYDDLREKGGGVVPFVGGRGPVLPRRWCRCSMFHSERGGGTF